MALLTTMYLLLGRSDWGVGEKGSISTGNHWKIYHLSRTTIVILTFTISVVQWATLIHYGQYTGPQIKILLVTSLLRFKVQTRSSGVPGLLCDAGSSAGSSAGSWVSRRNGGTAMHSLNVTLWKWPSFSHLLLFGKISRNVWATVFDHHHHLLINTHTHFCFFFFYKRNTNQKLLAIIWQMVL